MKALILVSGWSGPGIEWKYSAIPLEAMANGYKVIHFKPCNFGWGDIRHNGKKLARLALSLKYEAGYDEIVVVGHSMGGLIARCADIALNESGYTAIDAVCTIGTPHYGTKPAKAVSFSTSASQMAINSPFLNKINSTKSHHSSRYMALACKYDILVFPHENALWAGAHVNQYISTTHVGAIYSTRVAKLIMAFFNHS